MWPRSTWPRLIVIFSLSLPVLGRNSRTFPSVIYHLTAILSDGMWGQAERVQATPWIQGKHRGGYGAALARSTASTAISGGVSRAGRFSNHLFSLSKSPDPRRLRAVRFVTRCIFGRCAKLPHEPVSTRQEHSVR